MSLSRRWDSAATVSKTIDDLPEPDTPVKTVIAPLGMSSETSRRLFSRAPRMMIEPWIVASYRSCSTDSTLPAGSRNHAMNGPPSRMMPRSSSGTPS